MTWKHVIDELDERRHIAENMGGAEAIERQHSHGKLTARERITALLDESSFREIGGLVGKGVYDGAELRSFTPANIVIGEGDVEGRRVVVSADDYTIRAGSSEAAAPDKWQYAEQLAYRESKPLVRFVDMAGGSVKLLEQQGASKLPGYPQWPWVEMLSHIPVVGVACGPCAGLGAQKVAATHFSVQVREVGQVFAAGPRVVGPGIGEHVDKEELGGVDVHAQGSGVVDNAAADEFDAIAQVRRWLSYMPRNVYEGPPRVETGDPVDRREEDLLELIPTNTRHVYDVRKLIELVFDTGSVFEIGAGWGRGAFTGLARLDGYSVGILASNPRHYGGAQGEHEAEKYTRFIDVCDTFGIPIVNLHDQAGSRIGVEAEKRGTVRKTLRTLVAINQTSVPWFSLIVRRSFGLAGAGWGPWSGCRRVAWPSGRWGSIPVEGGVYAAYRSEIDSAESPADRQKELEEYYHELGSPLRTAEKFGVDDIIDPRDTRPMLCDWIRDVNANQMRSNEPRKRGFRP